MHRIEIGSPHPPKIRGGEVCHIGGKARSQHSSYRLRKGIKFAGGCHGGVTGENLLDQCRARARHAKDKPDIVGDIWS